MTIRLNDQSQYNASLCKQISLLYLLIIPAMRYSEEVHNKQVTASDRLTYRSHEDIKREKNVSINQKSDFIVLANSNTAF